MGALCTVCRNRSEAPDFSKWSSNVAKAKNLRFEGVLPISPNYIGTDDDQMKVLRSHRLYRFHLYLLKTVLFLSCFCAVTTQAQLAVTVSKPKIAGQKAVVPLQMENEFNQKIESARASVFLLDEKGKMVGQSTKWVIGGTKIQASLAPGASNSFFFVITSEKPFTTTNLTTKVNFNRVVLEGGKLVDTVKDVQIQTAR